MNRVLLTLASSLDAERSTEIQRLTLAFHAVLADAWQLGDDERRAFTSIAARAFVRSLGGDLIVAEAEDALRRAA